MESVLTNYNRLKNRLFVYIIIIIIILVKENRYTYYYSSD